MRPVALIAQPKAGQAHEINFAPALFTVVFSEPVAGFDGTDVNLSAPTVGGTPVASVTGSGTTYEVSVSGMTVDGNIIVSLPADAATDLAGNTSNASTSTDNTVAWYPRYTVSGTVTGLVGNGLTMRLNFGTPLVLNSGDTSFTFFTTRYFYQSYSITFDAQPTSPAQTCTLTNGSGPGQYTDVTNVLVTCVTDP